MALHYNEYESTAIPKFNIRPHIPSVGGCLVSS